MENKAHALAAGAFLIVVTALLAGLALWLTRDVTQYRYYELSSRESVSGLLPQAAVRYKGVAVGKVMDIGFDPQTQGNVLIRIAVSVDAPVRPSTFAVLGYQGVTGLAHILLDDADQPLPALPTGPSGTPRLALQSSPLSKLAEQGPAVLGQMQQAAERLNHLLSDENQRQLMRTVTHIGDAAAGLTQLGQRLERTVTLKLDPALASVPALVGESRRTLAVVQQSVQQAGEATAQAALRLDESLARMNAPDGTLEKIETSTQAVARAANRFNDATLSRIHRASDEAARAARQVGRLSGQVADNPQAFLYGAPELQPGPGEDGFVPPTALEARP